MPPTLVGDRTAESLCRHLSNQVAGPTVGLVSPSDPLAMISGYIGMYWDGGHVGYEEQLAMLTLLVCLMHKEPAAPARMRAGTAGIA